MHVLVKNSRYFVLVKNVVSYMSLFFSETKILDMTVSV